MAVSEGSHPISGTTETDPSVSSKTRRAIVRPYVTLRLVISSPNWSGICFSTTSALCGVLDEDAVPDIKSEDLISPKL